MSRAQYNIDLNAHMAECDANYMRLMKLMPNLFDIDHQVLHLIVAEQKMSLHFRVLERSPYTTLVQLIQQSGFNGLHFDLPSPQLSIRMYHDTRSAEVVEFQNEERFRPVYAYPNQRMRQRDEKVQVNRFLSEYLSACLTHGAATSRVTLPSTMDP